MLWRGIQLFLVALLFIEISCRDRHWTETSRGVMGPDNKIMFRRRTLSPYAIPIKPDTIHLAAYNYLCGDDDIIAQHNHQ